MLEINGIVIGEGHEVESLHYVNGKLIINGKTITDDQQIPGITRICDSEFIKT